jgi:hypothetical protein
VPPPPSAMTCVFRPVSWGVWWWWGGGGGGGGAWVGVDSLGLTEFGSFLSRGEEYGTGAGSSVTHISRKLIKCSRLVLHVTVHLIQKNKSDVRRRTIPTVVRYEKKNVVLGIPRTSRGGLL